VADSVNDHHLVDDSPEVEVDDEVDEKVGKLLFSYKKTKNEKILINYSMTMFVILCWKLY
jgi:hypothetical protein